MAKRSSRIPEVRERTELNCMWGLLSILQSCQGFTTPKVISNGRPVSRHAIDHPSRLDQLTSFDGECRKIQLQNVDLDRVAFNGSYRGSRNLEKLFTGNDAGQMVAEISLKRLTLAALLEAVSAENHPEESLESECFRRSLSLGNYSAADPIYGERMFKQQRTKSDSKSFSDALEVLNSNKDSRIMDLLPEPDSLLSRGSKNICRSRSERQTIKSLLDAKLTEYERENVRTSGKTRSTQAKKEKKTNKRSLQKLGYQCSCSPKTSLSIQPNDKIVVLQPASQSAKNVEYVSFHCSTTQSRRSLSRMISDATASSLTFRGSKKQLKNTVGIPRDCPSQCSVNGTSDALARNKSAREAGDDCIHFGVDKRSSCTSSPNVNTDGELWKKQELKSSRDHNAACSPDRNGKSKIEFDVILEAKRRLSERLEKLNDVAAVQDEKSVRTLRRILASPKHEFLPLSPRRESQYCPGSAHTRLSPNYASLGVAESGFEMQNVRERACLSPLRPNTEMALCADYKNYDASEKSSLIPSPDQAHKSGSYMAGNKKFNGDPKIVETNGVLEPESYNLEVLNDVNSGGVTTPLLMADTTDLHKDDDSGVHSLMDSLSENEAFTSTADDFQSTPSSIYQLDMAENIKYQEEHQSPVSVLEPFFIEDGNSPQNMTLKTAQKKLRPLRLDFEENSVGNSPHDPATSESSCAEEQDHLSEYVHLVLQASCLDWDQLSKITILPEELLCPSLFDEVEYLLTDCFFDPKLLFDHINEVLIDIHCSYFCSCPSSSLVKPKTMSEPLAKLVIDEVMKQADFYLLPQTERRTLIQLVSKDVENSRSWLDVRLDTEQIVAYISEDFLEGCIIDTLLEPKPIT
ncbi:uncharacterized protein LOC127255509 isoform X2 [Andrographis paniculata]|uniref:uncharacterized protein LOC127255509 isoform X2 n=1 Tax=Andrographis paniculata TaxID=175694 RepID=UPI0021E88700|nr:uncharacterized protein LOC127255509 isoform X2 [Andrographis paniculata]